MEGKITVFGKEFSAKEGFDQHFLVERKYLSVLIKEARITKKDTVLEIGAGNGSLTRLLAKTAGRVIAIEIDKELAKILRENLKSKNVKIICGDALKIIRKERPHFNKIASNLPYMILEPLFLEMAHLEFSSAVFTISRTFAERILNDMSSEKATRITFISRAFFSPKKVCDVPKEAFEPPPRSGSIIISMRKKKTSDYKEDMASFLFKEIFLRRESKLKNALREGLILYDKLFGNGDVTKRTAKGAVKAMKLGDMGEKRCANLSNDDLRVVFKAISMT